MPTTRKAMAELEGFLCPLCKADCRSVHELEKHYREEHEESSSGRTKLINNFKNFVDMAKTSLKIDTSPKSGARDAGRERTDTQSSASAECSLSLSTEGPVTNVSGISTELWEPQGIGYMATHTFDFRRSRDAHFSERVVATNRLVIRVEKLFRLLKEAAPRNAKEMRSVEQSVVPWRQDENEKLCQTCGNKFGVRRRRHHCRLCGGIMCKQCSQFVTLTEAYPILSDCPTYKELAPPSPAPRRKGIFKKDRDGGEDDESRDDIRTCPECRGLIKRKLERLNGCKKPDYMVMYERMKEKMQESERLKPPFIEVAQQLWSGENVAGLKAAALQRQGLLQVYENVDSFSKKILGQTAASPSPLVRKLARYIRVYASNYLQDHLLRLPTVPTLDQFQEIKEQKEREAIERLREIERQREEQRLLNLKLEREAGTVLSHEVDSGMGKISAELDSGLGKISAGVGKFTAEMDRRLLDKFKKDKTAPGMSGWVGEEGQDQGRGGWMCAPDMVVRDADEDEADPFVVQREQLLSYIAQARQARRMDEVRALEQSLREIEQVMRDRKRDRKRSFGTSN